MIRRSFCIVTVFSYRLNYTVTWGAGSEYFKFLRKRTGKKLGMEWTVNILDCGLFWKRPISPKGEEG